MKTKTKKRKPVITWTTAAGAVIPIKELEDSHLVNIIHHLVRRKERMRLGAELLSDCYYDHPLEMLFENYAAQIADQTLEETIPIARHLLAEVKRRKLGDQL